MIQSNHLSLFIFPYIRSKRNIERQTRPKYEPDLRFQLWAESYFVVSSGTSEGACFVVISVAIGVRASSLKNHRVICRRTSLRRRVSSTAAILISTVLLTGTLTRHNIVLINDLKIVRASRVEVGNTACVLAISGSSGWSYP